MLVLKSKSGAELFYWIKKPPMFVFKDIEVYKNRGKNVAWRIAKVDM